MQMLFLYRFGQSTDWIDHLIFTLTFIDVVVADLWTKSFEWIAQWIVRTLMRGLSRPLMRSAASTPSKCATFSQSSVPSDSACSSLGRCFHWALPKCMIAAVHLNRLIFSPLNTVTQHSFHNEPLNNADLCKTEYIECFVRQSHFFGIVHSVDCQHALRDVEVLRWILFKKAFL